jgi:hypothetical protein
MLTITDGPVRVVPGPCYGEGTGFEKHEYFEAASIRKYKDTYYFIYSSSPMHELCYATSEHPMKGFEYGGVIVSNCDMRIGGYKPADKQAYPGGNNHGSIAEINGQWYIFYHRQTNGTWFSRQGCIERINIDGDGRIKQVEMTSLGANNGALAGCGEYPTYIACNLFRTDWERTRVPKITKDGWDGDEEQGYIADITEGCVIGFKYFDCAGVKKVKIKTRGYCGGAFELRTSLESEALGRIPVAFTNIWTEFSADIAIPDGVHSLFFIYTGGGNAQFASFALE